MDYTVWKFTGGPVATNGFLIGDPLTKDAILFDAPKDIAIPLIAEVRRAGYRLTGLINSHGHWDHIADNAPVQDGSQSPIACHPDDEYRLANPTAGGSFMLPFEIVPTTPARRLNEGDGVQVGRLAFRVLHTPGHTEGSMCLYEPSQGILLSGDTLFAGTHGRTDFPGGDQRWIEKSLLRLADDIPADTRILPGHGPETMMGHEVGWIREMYARR